MSEEKSEKHEGHEHHEHSEAKTITIKKDALWKGAVFVLLAALVVSMFTGGFGIGKVTGNAAAGDNGSNAAAQQTGSTVSIDFSSLVQPDTIIMGSDNAPVTVVEFTDFSCPYCAMASGDSAALTAYAKQNFGSSWEPIVSNLMSDYVNTGKVRLVIKYTMGHTGGHPAQLIAWCLNDQDPTLDEKYYSKVFATDTLDSTGNYVTGSENQTEMLGIAKDLGADMTKLQSCIDSGKYDSRFSQEQSEGSKLGVQGTPSFFVGKSSGSTAVYISGAQPYSTFKQTVNAAM